MKAQNIPEFIALIKRYESITIQEIEEAWNAKSIIFSSKSIRAANALTGFGLDSTCKMCLGAGGSCSSCVYFAVVDEKETEEYEGCHAYEMADSYYDIQFATKQTELLAAFRNRAKAMREFAKNKGIEIN